MADAYTRLGVSEFAGAAAIAERGGSVAKQMSTVFKAVAHAESAYAKALHEAASSEAARFASSNMFKLFSSGKGEPRPDALHSVQTGWSLILDGLHTAAKTHSQVAVDMLNDVTRPLAAVAAKNLPASAISKGKGLLSNLRSAEAAVSAALKTFAKAKSDLKAARRAYHTEPELDKKHKARDAYTAALATATRLKDDVLQAHSRATEFATSVTKLQLPEVYASLEAAERERAAVVDAAYERYAQLVHISLPPLAVDDDLAALAEAIQGDGPGCNVDIADLVPPLDPDDLADVDLDGETPTAKVSRSPLLAPPQQPVESAAQEQPLVAAAASASASKPKQPPQQPMFTGGAGPSVSSKDDEWASVDSEAEARAAARRERQRLRREQMAAMAAARAQRDAHGAMPIIAHEDEDDTSGARTPGVAPSAWAVPVALESGDMDSSGAVSPSGSEAKTSRFRSFLSKLGVGTTSKRKGGSGSIEGELVPALVVAEAEAAASAAYAASSNPDMAASASDMSSAGTFGTGPIDTAGPAAAAGPDPDRLPSEPPTDAPRRRSASMKESGGSRRSSSKKRSRSRSRSRSGRRSRSTKSKSRNQSTTASSRAAPPKTAIPPPSSEPAAAASSSTGSHTRAELVAMIRQLAAHSRANDYYGLFGITDPRAPLAAIAKKRRELTQKYHPDHQPDGEARAAATAALQRINSAFTNVLRSPDTRMVYNKLCKYRSSYKQMTLGSLNRAQLDLAAGNLRGLLTEVEAHNMPVEVVSEVRLCLKIIKARSSAATS